MQVQMMAWICQNTTEIYSFTALYNRRQSSTNNAYINTYDIYKMYNRLHKKPILKTLSPKTPETNTF
jgi:hypothetical protein